MQKKEKVHIGNSTWLTIEDIYHISRQNAELVFTSEKRSLMEKSDAILAKQIEARTLIYGINTQFGDQVTLFDRHINNGLNAYQHSISERQYNLVRSHNVGAGDPVDHPAVRATIALRAQSLSQGYSAIRPQIIDSLILLLDNDILPIIPKYGSIGASGDLIPLSYISATLCGHKNTVLHEGTNKTADRALRSIRVKPLKLRHREGLALINGTSFMTAITSLAFHDLKRIYKQMLDATAMNLEAMLVIDSAYQPIVHKIKHHEGQSAVAKNMLRFWKGSSLVSKLNAIRDKSIKEFSEQNNALPEHLQDYYSLRAVAQGFGPFHENLLTTEKWIEEEINSVNDNPITCPDTECIEHTANFMGYYITEACDLLKMDIAQASSWLHAIFSNIVHPRRNKGLPVNLIHYPDKYNGFRPIQLLIASLVVQNRKLAQVQQAFMVPTEGDNQDVNSLGTHAAHDFRDAVNNLETIVAAMYLSGAQGIDLRGKEKAGKRSQEILQSIRTKVPKIEKDIEFDHEIEKVVELMRNGSL